MDKLKCPICYTEVEEGNFKETYVSPLQRRRFRGKMLKFGSEISDWRNKSEIIRQSVQKFLNYERWLDQWEELYKLENLK